MAGPPTEGKTAPAFSLDSTEGKAISLSDYKGRKIVLYFYPKDNTSGCTAEACNFRDSFSDFKKAGAVILGISPDALKSHDKFKAKFDLPFPLLADPDHAVAEKYGVWKEKSMYGKKYMGIERSTFVIDSAGKIAKIFAKVKVPKHHEEVLEAIKAAT
ncbi:MAG TPA: thioredoxin-dependent thiol peroxidase [Phycisphaerae bacterium]|nr:thioredoxin-dependent thiol peroxidase [Phycisphaerae bacterium]